jgi:hypothetical protein
MPILETRLHFTTLGRQSRLDLPRLTWADKVPGYLHFSLSTPGLLLQYQKYGHT